MNPADDPSDNIRKKPPSQFIDNQYNICPKIVSQYIESVNVEWSSMLDFGCGQGIKALSLALMHLEKTVVGVDITEAYQKAYEFARDHLHLTKMPENLRFYKITPGQSLGTIIKPDVIYNWSVLEHVERKLIPEIIQDMYQSLNDKGLVFVQIAPLYFSPYGSHLRDYVSKPWAHLELSHENLRLLVEDKDNEALSIEERNGRKWKFSQYELLNKITASELSDYFIAAGFDFEHKEINQINERPPMELLKIYNEEVLINHEIIYVLKKSQKLKKNFIFSFFDSESAAN